MVLDLADVLTPAGLTALLSVVLIDLTMAGDNVVVMGTIASGLPERERRRVIMVGVAMALIFLIGFALTATWLLQLTGLLLAGGLLLLWLSGHTLNVYSMIGLILLIGLVAKNSILLVDVTNQFRAAGHAVDDALRASCPLRLRPVLMTSLTVILAMLPAALGLGAGAETNGPLAVAVIGGMISSTLLTLAVVPAAYSLLENRRQAQ